jgi:hypothetical protein
MPRTHMKQWKPCESPTLEPVQPPGGPRLEINLSLTTLAVALSEGGENQVDKSTKVSSYGHVGLSRMGMGVQKPKVRSIDKLHKRAMGNAITSGETNAQSTRKHIRIQMGRRPSRERRRKGARGNEREK